MADNNKKNPSLYAAYVDQNITKINALINANAQFDKAIDISPLQDTDIYFAISNLIQNGAERQVLYLLDSEEVTINTSYAAAPFCDKAITAQKYSLAEKLITHPKFDFSTDEKKSMLSTLAAVIVESDCYFDPSYHPIRDLLTKDDTMLEAHFHSQCFTAACKAGNVKIAETLQHHDFKLNCSIDLQITLQIHDASSPKKIDHNMRKILLKHVEWDGFGQSSLIENAIEHKNPDLIHDFIDSGNNHILRSESKEKLLQYGFMQRDDKIIQVAIDQSDVSKPTTRRSVHLCAYAFNATDLLPEQLCADLDAMPLDDKNTLINDAITTCIKHDAYNRAWEIFRETKHDLEMPADAWLEHCSKMLEQGQINFTKSLLTDTKIKNSVLRDRKHELSALMESIGVYAKGDEQELLFTALYEQLERYNYPQTQKCLVQAATEAVFNAQDFSYMLDKIETINHDDWDRRFSWSNEISKFSEKYEIEDIKALLNKCDVVPEQIINAIFDHNNIEHISYLVAEKAADIPTKRAYASYLNAAIENNTALIHTLTPHIEKLNNDENAQDVKEQASYDAIYDAIYETKTLLSKIEKIDSALGLPLKTQEKRRHESTTGTFFDSDIHCIIYQLIYTSSDQIDAAAHLIEQGCAFKKEAVTALLRKVNKIAAPQFNYILDKMVNTPFNDVITENASDMAYHMISADLQLSHYQKMFSTGMLSHIDNHSTLSNLHEMVAMKEAEHTKLTQPLASDMIQKRIQYLNDRTDILNLTAKHKFEQASQLQQGKKLTSDERDTLKDEFAKIFTKSSTTSDAFINKDHAVSLKGSKR